MLLPFFVPSRGAGPGSSPAAGLGSAKYWLVSSPGVQGDDVRGGPSIGL